ncbi:MAG TPA: hypothetical protein VFL83_01065 [Anaeromyxobacter sp.]|nr:hypothetical protein [Anaeromyxobacter sp.]
MTRATSGRIRTSRGSTARPSPGRSGYYANLWAPLTWLSLALDRAIWGLDPVGFHLTNVVLHALDAGLFFLVALRLLGALAAARAGADAEGAERRALRGALVAALLFAVHPLRVESVAWAAERKDVLALFFGLAAMLAYLRHVESERVRATPPEVPPSALGTSRSFWAAVALFCPSLLAKPMLVTLPAVLLLLDWAPLGRIRAAGLRRIVAEKVPFLLASGAALAVAADSVRTNALSLAQAGVLSRGLVALESTAAYLWLTVWPLRISPFYVHPVNLARPGPEHVASAALLASITIGCALAARRGRPALLPAWLVYLVGLAPVLGFHQVGPQAMAARFTYFPSLPIALVLGAVVARAALGARRRWAALLLATGAAAWIATLAAVTVRDLSFWRDDVTLWTRVIDGQGLPRAQQRLGAEGRARARPRRRGRGARHRHAEALRARLGASRRARADPREHGAVSRRPRGLRGGARVRPGRRAGGGALVPERAPPRDGRACARGGGRRGGGSDAMRWRRRAHPRSASNSHHSPSRTTSRMGTVAWRNNARGSTGARTTK